MCVMCSSQRSHHVRCVSPPTAAGFVSVQLSSNGQNYTRAAAFEYYWPVELHSVEPPHCPIDGCAVAEGERLLGVIRLPSGETI